MINDARKLAVLGYPIAHSKSPALHRAAYEELGLDWEYSSIEVKSGELERFLAECDSQWRGLSLTMPLKREVLSSLSEIDHVSQIVGATNTVLFDGGTSYGFNTDVYGAERMLREALSAAPRHALIIGAGATACSVMVSLANLGVHKVTVATRTPSRSTELKDVADRVGLAVTVGAMDVETVKPDVVISTLPGTVELSSSFSCDLRATVPLVDIAYDPWPTAIAQHWLDAGGAIVGNGLRMLIYQALAQIRVFLSGDPSLELPSESKVLAAMRSAAFDTT